MKGPVTRLTELCGVWRAGLALSQCSHGWSRGAFLLACLLGVNLSDFRAGFQLSLQPAIRLLGTSCHLAMPGLAAQPVFSISPLQAREFTNSPTQLSEPQNSLVLFSRMSFQNKNWVFHTMLLLHALNFALRRSICAHGSSCVSFFKPSFCGSKSELFPWFQCFSLLLLVTVEEIGLTPQGEKSGNAEKLAEYICSSE